MSSTMSRPQNLNPSEATVTDGRSLRFLIDHRLGRLVVGGAQSPDPMVALVHYTWDGKGGFVSHLPRDSEIVEAIRRGEPVMLSVHPQHTWMPPDADGDSSGETDLVSVQGQMKAELVEDAEGVRQILGHQIAALLDSLPQQDKSDPLDRAGESSLQRLVGVRLWPLRLRARLARQADLTAV